MGSGLVSMENTLVLHVFNIFKSLLGIFFFFFSMTSEMRGDVRFALFPQWPDIKQMQSVCDCIISNETKIKIHKVKNINTGKR